MQHPDPREYAPYFYDGKLHLPPKTIQLLMDAGLSCTIGAAALCGLSLDDDREWITEISNMLEVSLGQIAEEDMAFRVLITEETHFMLAAWSLAGAQVA